jgi:14-3-3 protein epsilon
MLVPHELSVEERNLISVAYSNIIGARRASWRILSSIESREQNRGESEYRVRQCTRFKEKIEEEICTICKEVFEIVGELVGRTPISPESKIFYLKMYVIISVEKAYVERRRSRGRNQKRRKH